MLWLDIAIGIFVGANLNSLWKGFLGALIEIAKERKKKKEMK